MLRTLLVVTALLIATPVIAQEKCNVVVYRQIAIDHKINPEGWVDVFASREFKAGATIVATAMGVDPATAARTVAVVGAIADTQTWRGQEQVDYDMPLNGYRFCASRVKVFSTVPASGKKAALLHVHADEQRVRASAWAPQLKAFSGGGSLVATVEIVGMKHKYYDKAKARGYCGNFIDGVQTIAQCKGRNQCSSTYPIGSLNDMGSMVKAIIKEDPDLEDCLPQ